MLRLKDSIINGLGKVLDLINLLEKKMSGNPFIGISFGMGVSLVLLFLHLNVDFDERQMMNQYEMFAPVVMFTALSLWPKRKNKEANIEGFETTLKEVEVAE